MRLQDRFQLDEQRNILFINFAGLRIESREQVDDMERHVREAYERQGRRIYAVVNYEGTEVAPELIDDYGERIKWLSERYGIATVRYSSSGATRSVLRYLGAAKDLESNIFASREAAIRAIQEIEDRRADRQEIRQADRESSALNWFDPRRSVIGKLMAVWFLTALFLLADSGVSWAAVVVFIAAACVTALVAHFKVVRPLRRMESFARQMVGGGGMEPLIVESEDEAGQLAQALNGTAKQLRHDIERLSGLYHISLMMGTGTETDKIGELLTRKIARLLDAEMCVILLYDEREKVISAQLPGFGVNEGTLRQLRSELSGKSIATWVFNTGESYLTNDAGNDPIISREVAAALGVREMLAVPLQAGERRLGTLEVMNKPGGFLEEDKQLVTIFAAQAAQLLANAQLFQQSLANERLAAVGELVTGFAHEVRNPLCGITTTLSALERKLEDRETVKPFVEVVKSEADRLNQLMERLLEHSRPVKLSGELTDIRDIINEAIAEFSEKAESLGVRLHFDSTESTSKLRLDRLKMRGVFVNLLDNALQHTSGGGKVRVTVSTTNDGGTKRLQIEVRDTGCGIAPEEIGKIFDPFFTTRPSGTGLGLAITRKTIHDHGGTINVQSEQERGTSFVINLPLLQ